VWLKKREIQSLSFFFTEGHQLNFLKIKLVSKGLHSHRGQMGAIPSVQPPVCDSRNQINGSYRQTNQLSCAFTVDLPHSIFGKG